MGNKSPPIPLKRALGWILLNVFFVSGIAWMGFGVYIYFWNTRVYDARYTIVSIVQTGREKEALKTIYLEELLGLSKKTPQNLYRFDLKKAKNQLLSSPLIEEATLKRIPPNTLYIDYLVRKPAAFLGDTTNTAMNEEGVLFPFHPFFSPKNLPVLVLGVQKEDVKWGKKVENNKCSLAFAVLKDLEGRKNPFRVKKIDVSKADAKSLGSRQIVATIQNKDEEATLILSTEHYSEGIDRYEILLNLTLDSFQVVDLRLNQLAYLQR